ncbi:MAG: GIY-YIG nuclease family protein [Sphingorhabdus sp.]
MLIQNYGLFWKADRVKWGAGKNKGTLEGYLTGAKREGSVDFREQRGVYVLYDDTFRIVYVGQAGRGNHTLFGRLKTHRRDHLAERWSRFSWFGVREVTVNWVLGKDTDFKTDLPSVLSHIEAILIATAEPPLNLQRGRFGADVEQYLQQPVDS